jgi:protocatechuate 3,4-dioxygenase beta subunit
MSLRLASSLLVAAQVVALAQQAPLTIHGRVSASDTRAALPRARVTVVVDRDPSPPVYTDDRGEFSIAAPSEDTFTLTVVKAGYAAMQLPLQRAAFVARPQELAIGLTRSAAINGRVVDTNGETLVGVRVYADRIDPEPDTPPGLVKFVTTTDDRGDYRVGGLPPGRYSVTAVSAQDPGAVLTLDLRPGDDLSGIGFTALPPPTTAIEPSPQPRETPDRATIRGRVLTTTGRPIAKAVLNIRGPVPTTYFMTVTDAQGRFAYTGLMPGNYELAATRGDFLPGTGQESAFESHSRIAVTAGARINDVTLVLSRGLAVTGTIVDRAGEPVQGMTIQALRLGTGAAQRRAVLAGALVGGSRQTDDRGRYRVLGLLPGTYVIAALADAASLGHGSTAAQAVPFYFPGSASIADAVTVTITATDVEGIDFAVADVPTARVTGVALDSTGAPLRGTITLAVSHRSGSIVPAPRTTQPGADGAFSFVNVAAGDYVIQAFRIPGPNEFPSNPRLVDPREAYEFAAQYVTVGGQDAEPVTLRASRGAVMDVRVVAEAEVPHDPYDRIQIESHPVGFDMASLSYSSSLSLRMVDGRIRIGGLTGPRRFALSGVPDGWYLKLLTVDGLDVTDRVVDFGVGAGATVSAEVVISAKGGSVIGRIPREGRTARGNSVVVFPQNREKWFERSRFVKAVRAAQDGSFRAPSLPPGEYYVAATATIVEPGATMTADALEQLVSRAARVTLDEGEERKVDLSR